MSFGFIEHFDDYNEIIKRHLKLVNINGKVIITVPNMKYGLPKILHKYLNPYQFSEHNIDAMDYSNWKAIVEEAGFKIIFLGGFGEMRFCKDYDTRYSRINKMVGAFFRFVCNKFLHQLPFKGRGFNAYIGLVAEKNKN